MLEGMWRKGNIYCTVEGMYIATTTTEWRFPKKLGVELPYDPTIPLPGLDLKKI